MPSLIKYFRYFKLSRSSSMTNMPVLSFYIFLHLLLVCESSYHSRIASVYYGVYLDENFSPSKTPTYWKFQDNQTIHTPDASQALCINTFKHLDLCALGNGSQWSYEGGKMGLYAMSGADKYYMSLSDQVADVKLHQSGNSEKILLAPAAGDTDNPVVLKLGQALKSLREDLASVREKYNDILALKESMVNRSDSLMDEARASEEKYDGNVTLIAEKLTYLKSEEEDINTSMTQKLQKMNDTEYSMKNSVFPTISKEINDIISKPDAFKEKLRMTDLEDYLNEQIAKVNKTLRGYLHKHR